MPRCHLIKGKMTPGPPDQCWVSPYQHSRKAGHPRLEKDQIHGLFGKKGVQRRPCKAQSAPQGCGPKAQVTLEAVADRGHPKMPSRRLQLFNLKRRKQQNAGR
jgi:hypothetical protein